MTVTGQAIRSDEWRRDSILFNRYRRDDDRRARDELIARKLPLAKALARRYAIRRSEREDLGQVAAMGLVKAVDRYDPSLGTAFSSFAVPTITGELRRHLRDTTWAAHVPRGTQELAVELGKFIDELSAETGRSPTIADLVRASGRAPEEVLEALDARQAFDADSLDAPAREGDDDDGPRHEQVGAPDEGFDAVVDRATIQSMVERLPQRERELLRLRFDEGLTQRQIGKRLGISQMHVSRLLRRALDRASVLASA
jgi:RNA polymerase sigma-B factor